MICATRERGLVASPSGVITVLEPASAAIPRRLSRRIARALIILLLIGGAYAFVRFKRSELVDFVVPRTAAARFLAHESLYRADDGHFQYKYLPAFAEVMVPFALIPREPASFLWFTLTVALAAAFVTVSLSALPDRRWPKRALVGVTLLVTGKFFVLELVFGQFNLPLALLLMCAVVAAQRGYRFAGGAAVAAGVFVKPYALVLIPWLAWTRGWRPFATFGFVTAIGLLLPAASYGWTGNWELLEGWYRTVTQTTAPNLLSRENISFASMWAKWIGPGAMAEGLALVSIVATTAAGLLMMWRRRLVAEPNYLEAAYFFLLVPLLSPQGWDYVLVLAVPAYMCLVDRSRDLSPAWRSVAVVGVFLTSFTIFDLLGRWLYFRLMDVAAISVGTCLIAACLVRLRLRALA